MCRTSVSYTSWRTTVSTIHFLVFISTKAAKRKSSRCYGLNDVWVLHVLELGTLSETRNQYVIAVRNLVGTFQLRRFIVILQMLIGHQTRERWSNIDTSPMAKSSKPFRKVSHGDGMHYQIYSLDYRTLSPWCQSTLIFKPVCCLVLW